ncbi:MAG: hypothetical protein ACTICQ_13465 [Glutamicibacter arilaitensis]|uniref:hypothetical protein n=1 Tax=Glutamicibacter arilaitensis TaxID=256701 RepID=UPI003FB77AC4
MDNEMILLDGFPLTGPAREGVWKRLGELEGWFDSPDPKRKSVQRENGDGNYPSEIHYESRLITFTGRVTSKNHKYLHEAGNRLVALPGRGGKQFVVKGHGPTQEAIVDPRGKVSITFPTDTRMEFQIPLEAVDPFKYGERRFKSVASGASDTVFHRGTVEAWPSVTVSGSMPDGYTVTIGGQSVSVPMGIPSGATHTIDYRRRRLYVNGSLFMGAFGASNFRSVPPGRRTTAALAAPSGSGSATFTVYDTYV